ncbi:FadR/GntR family transcriptional regulator [Paenibacillus koleovorans]|uniref:FadR/GntR family transcriptional regulator n=1 Tax=Paenibacillus koleovorans TaxID=121608 RepID=UPI000FD9A9A8|nr:FCD domain-containing protein [Paenibacillus koleovorans]
MEQDLGFDGIAQNPLHAASLAEQTAQRILTAICDGKLREEQPFPSQYQLGEWFGVSRTVIREATQLLVSKGVLDVKHGKRIVIKPPSHEPISESLGLAFRRKGVSVQQVLELRRPVEAEAAALAAQFAETSDLERMEQTIVEMEANLDKEKGYVDADVAFHNALFRATKQPAFELLLMSLNEYMTESRRLSYRGPEPTKRALEAHKRILHAVCNKDKEAARQAMLEHLGETERDLRELI